MVTQFFLNGIIAGCSYALTALGFALIYNTTRTFHFAHGAVYTLSAYVFYTLYSLWGWPIIASIALTVTFIALLGIAIDECVYSPLLKSKSSLLIQLLSSIGLYVVIINFISMIYGNESRIVSSVIHPTYLFGKVIITRIQVVTALSFVVIFAGFIVVLKKVNFGKTIRAMRDNPELISVMGINPKSVRRAVFALGSSLAAVSAMLVSLDVGMDPNIGMAAVMNAAVAVIIGGVGIFEGAVFGALFLGLLQSFAVWQFSTRWQDIVTFLTLILFILFRPEGIFGNRRRVEEVVV